MRPTSAAIALSSLLVSTSATAGVLQELDPKGETGTVWSTDSGKALAAYVPAGIYTVVEEAAAPRGPGGGVLLAKAGRVSLEVDAAAGTIVAVTVNGKGAIVDRTLMVNMKRAAPKAFEPGSGIQLIVKARKARDISSSAVLTGSTATDRLFLLDITTYASYGTKAEILDEAALAFDVETLEPRVGRKLEPTYWYAAHTTYWNATK